MGFIKIDNEKCSRDGFCVNDCPLRLLALPADGGVPQTVPGAEALCIKCGHCLSVCPHAALTLNNTSPDNCVELKALSQPDFTQVKNMMQSRRSIRRFSKEPVNKEDLSEILSVAAYAPSGHNSQPVKWLVVYKKEEVRRLAGVVAEWMRDMISSNPAFAQMMLLDKIVAAWDAGQDMIMRDAPHAVIAYADKSIVTAPAACAIALSHFELAAHAKGAGAVWAGYFHVAATMFPAMQEALNLPSGHVCHGALMLGMPGVKYHRIPQRNEPSVIWR